MAADCQALHHHRLIRDTFRIGRFCFWAWFISNGQKKPLKRVAQREVCLKSAGIFGLLDKISFRAKSAFGALFARLLWSVAN